MNHGLGVLCDDLPLLRGRALSLLDAGPAAVPALARELFAIRYAPQPLAARLLREVLSSDRRFETSAGRWLLSYRDADCGSVPLAELDFVVVDVEATGGAPDRGDRITEIAAVRIRGGVVRESFESLVNPGRPIPSSVTALTNITDAMIAGAPRFADLSDELRSMLEGAVFVAHNAHFDWRLLQAEFKRCRGIRLAGERICTLRLARALHPELPHRSLPALADYYAIALDIWHRAGPDARATAELFVRFLDRLSEAGVTDWACLQRFLGGVHVDSEDHKEFERLA